MNHQSTCKISVIPTGKPYERTWDSIDKVTGLARKGSCHVMKGVMIPSDANTDPSAIKEVEFSVNVSKTGLAEKNIADIVELYFENKSAFEKGNAYVEVEAFMGPRMNKEGVVTFFTPWINNATVMQANDEDLPYIKAALAKEAQVF